MKEYSCYSEYSGLLNKLFNGIPSELKEIIIKLTYQQQPTELLTDIKSFVITKNKVLNDYTNHYTRLYKNPHRDLWLYNDLLGFVNSNIGLIFAFTPKFYEVFRRNIIIRNSRKYVTGSSILDVLSKNTPTMNINFILGLLTPDERTLFLNT